MTFITFCYLFRLIDPIKWPTVCYGQLSNNRYYMRDYGGIVYWNWPYKSGQEWSGRSSMKWAVKHEGEVKTDHTNRSKNSALTRTNRACITAMTETLLLLQSGLKECTITVPVDGSWKERKKYWINSNS